MSADWTRGRLVEDLGLVVRDVRPNAERLTELAGLAVRRNPRRRHLFVSTVLAKHVPTTGGVAVAAAGDLADLAHQRLRRASTCLVLSLGETATSLGRLVADRLVDSGMEADFVHSTRRRTGRQPLLEFAEPHSHAAEHVIAPRDADLVLRRRAVVLVDDEFSSGRTARNCLEALAALRPVDNVVLASLLDMRPSSVQGDLADWPAGHVESVSLAGADVGVAHVHPGALEAWRRSAARTERPSTRPHADVRRLAGSWSPDVSHRDEHGVSAASHRARHRQLSRLVERTAMALVGCAGPVHVVGTEELMYLPIRIAEALQQRLDEPVTVSSTTRSPAVVMDHADYPLRDGFEFSAHDISADAGTRFLYNVGIGQFSTIVLVVDVDTAEAGELVERLAERADVVVVLVLDEQEPDGVGPGAQRAG